MSLKHFLVAGALTGVLFGGGAAVAWAQTTTPTDPPSTTTPADPQTTPSTPEAPSTTPQSPEGRSHGNCPNMGSDSGSTDSGSSTDANTAFRMARSSSSRRV